MGSRISALLVVLAAAIAIGATAAHADDGAIRQASNMTNDDRAVADACIAKFEADGTQGTRDLLHRLSVEDFLLRKVQVRERRQEPDRVRLGFNFHNKLEVITVYMEADCPANLVDPHLPARSAKAGN